MDGLTVEMVFMLLSIYNAVRWVDMNTYWLMDIPLDNHWVPAKKKFCDSHSFFLKWHAVVIKKQTNEHK